MRAIIGISKSPLVLLLAILPLAACAQQDATKKSFDDPKAYSWYIRNMRYEINGKYKEFNQAFRAGSVAALKAARWRYYKEAESAESKLQNLVPFAKGDKGFRAAALELAQFYKTMTKKDYQAIIDYYEKGDLNKENISKIKEIVDRLTKQEITLDQKYIAALKAFELAHGLPPSE